VREDVGGFEIAKSLGIVLSKLTGFLSVGSENSIIHTAEGSGN
jgi:hypothetical protein